MKLFFHRFVIVITGAATVLFGSAIAPLSAFAGGSLAISKLVTSPTNISTDETFTVKAYVNSYYGVKTLSIYLDGVLQKVCTKKKTCAKALGPFDADAVGEHMYVVVVRDFDNQTQSQWGKFLVSATSSDTDVSSAAVIPPTPSTLTFEKIVTNSNRLFVGDRFITTIYATSNKNITQIDVLLDGSVVQSCNNAHVCTAMIGPFASGAIGEHTYVFVVRDASGNEIHPWGKFTVHAQ